MRFWCLAALRRCARLLRDCGSGAANGMSSARFEGGGNEELKTNPCGRKLGGARHSGPGNARRTAFPVSVSPPAALQTPETTPSTPNNPNKPRIVRQVPRIRVKLRCCGLLGAALALSERRSCFPFFRRRSCDRLRCLVRPIGTHKGSKS